jgi:acetate kinase
MRSRFYYDEAVYLVINSGSSSIKFAIYSASEHPALIVSGKLDGTSLSGVTAEGEKRFDERISLDDRDGATVRLIELLKSGGYLKDLAGVGYRIVHGGPSYTHPVRLNPDIVDKLRALKNFAPDHIPDQVAAIECIGRLLPGAPAVACFDTAFHRTIPRRAQLYGLTRKLADEGVVRYGFHGLSYAYIVSEMRRERTLPERLIVAHLGNGASMAAILNGQSIDTSMGFTPTAGFMMSNRSGDLDPGIILHLLRENGMSVDQVAELVNKGGGLKGLSGISADMQQLEKQAPANPAAAEAIEVFVYQIRKFLGAYLTILGGLDSLVFTGGIGENSVAVRAAVCAQLEHVGIELDVQRNRAGDPVISGDRSPTVVRIMKTNEELIIARYMREVLLTAYN